ncbi:MAG: MmgE/PrpD family protein [Oscillospiraceae bacterium]|nr:MmgE/PrpD family protein [Oscillospiraceae bacterium]
MLLQLAERLEKITFDKLDKKTAKKTKIAIMNYIGGSLPGADAGVTAAEKAMWESFCTTGSCVVIGHRYRTSAPAAAAVNAAMGQVFLQEDCHEKTLSHPGVIVIPVALALGQAMRASGRKFIEAVVAGYEGQGRIGIGLIRPGFPQNGLRPASFVGPFGAASAAAKMLGLDAAGIRDAVSVAGNTAAGVMEFSISGTEDICIQNCYSAKNGMMAAIEAKHGLRGAPSILEGRFGLGIALNDVRCDWSSLADDDDYVIDDTFIKIYPGCGHVLPTAQAAVALVKKHKIKAEDVKRVVVGTKPGGKAFPGCDNKGPFAGTISAMMSHQFMAASAIVTGNVDIAAIKRFADPEINALAERIFVEVDDEVTAAGHEKSGGRLTVEKNDGTVLTDYQEDTVPQSDEGVRQRLAVNGREYFSESRIEKIIDTVERLEELDDINDLADLLEPDK